MRRFFIGCHLPTYLHIDFLLSFESNKVHFGRALYANVWLPTFAAQIQIDSIFQQIAKAISETAIEIVIVGKIIAIILGIP